MSLPSRERGSKRSGTARPCVPRRSLPSRERGSKLRLANETAAPATSLPSRERGSKPVCRHQPLRRRRSLPSRERGSKHAQRARRGTEPRRSLHGSVDRNPNAGRRCACRSVAPFTGAWIETLLRGYDLTRFEVAPFTGAWIETPRVRAPPSKRCVAPFTGAWIETRRRLVGARGERRRSLHGSVDRNHFRHPLSLDGLVVAPFTGAWIETSPTCAAPG